MRKHSQRCPPNQALFDDTSNNQDQGGDDGQSRQRRRRTLHEDVQENYDTYYKQRILEFIDVTSNITNITDCLCPLNVENRGPKLEEVIPTVRFIPVPTTMPSEYPSEFPSEFVSTRTYCIYVSTYWLVFWIDANM